MIVMESCKSAGTVVTYWLVNGLSYCLLISTAPSISSSINPVPSSPSLQDLLASLRVLVKKNPSLITESSLRSLKKIAMQRMAFRGEVLVLLSQIDCVKQTQDSLQQKIAHTRSELMEIAAGIKELNKDIDRVERRANNVFLNSVSHSCGSSTNRK